MGAGHSETGKMGSLSRSKKQDYPVMSVFLKVVQPGGHFELYRDPIPAREIMRRFPRHCLTRPDFFHYPWIVVRPDSLLMPGKVFFLVPNHTVDKVIKDKLNQHQPRLMAPAGQGLDRYHRRSNTDPDQDSDSANLYKELFYESWKEMGTRLEQIHHESQESILESGRPSRELEVVQRVKPCLRKAGSGRKKLKLKVSFSSPIVTQRWTPMQGEDLDLKIFKYIHNVTEYLVAKGW